MGEKKKPDSGSHTALYRKYRSKSLDEIVGQEHITKTLQNAMKQGKVSHAYLFTGPRGTGKTSIARILAHELNNLPYEDESTHLDIIEIDAASNRRIDDIRDLRDKVHIAPLSAKYKVYIIDEVHMLTTESFNALLKTLEEPPAHVIFILATTEVHKLPATIISRTQRHSFKLIAKDEIVRHLQFIAEKEGIAIDQDALKLLAEHGGGSFRDSISLLDQMSGSESTIDAALVELLLGLAPKDALTSLLEATEHGDGKQILATVDSLLGSGLTPSAIATQLIALIRSQVQQTGASSAHAQLMQELLTVQSSQYPQLKLEVILLNVNPKAGSTDTPKKAVAADVVTSTKAASVTQAAQPKEDTDTSQPAAKQPKTPPKQVKTSTQDTAPQEKSAQQKPLSTDFSVAEHWSRVLDIVRSKNNSLYTVLRLATPEVEDGSLTLIFNFPFHRKKIEEVKYKAILAEALSEVGVDLPFTAVVDKSRARQVSDTPGAPTPTQTDPAHASLIAGIQDIMGGGDVVNV